MAVNREALFSALFARLQAQLTTNVKSYSRRWASWDDTPPALQPALLMLKGDEKSERKRVGTPLVWTFDLEIWLYAQDDGTAEATPSIQINNLLQLVETALEIQPGEATANGAQYLARRDGPPAGTSLGGLCLSCEIVGTVKVFEGTQGHTCIVQIPVQIVATA